MKRMKKIVSILLAAVMVLGMSMTVFADEEKNGSITIKPSENVSFTDKDEDGKEVTKVFNAYKVLDVVIINNNGEGQGNGYVYTVPDELKEFYAGRYGIELSAGNFDYAIAQEIAKEVGSDIAENVYTFAKEVLAAAKAAGIAPRAGSIEGENYVISDLPLGYYVVEDTAITAPVSALILDTPNANADTVIKADRPSIDKKIDGNKDTDDHTTGDVQYNNAAVGDKVPYVLRSNVPDMIGYEKYYFVVNDTLSKGLTFNNDAFITITASDHGFAADDDVDPMGIVNGQLVLLPVGFTAADDFDGFEGVQDDYIVVEKAYTIETSKSLICENTDEDHTHGDGCYTTGIEIVFNDFINYKAYAGAEITITYSATLNSGAVIGVEGNPNKVQLTYSNNPNKVGNGDPENPDKPNPNDPNEPTGKTPEQETRTFVTGIELTKVNADNETLQGAKFSIEGEKTNIVIINKEVYTLAENGTYYKLKDGTYTTEEPTLTVKNEEGTVTTKGNEDSYDSIVNKYELITVVTQETEKESIATDGYVNANGVLVFEGLSAGEYKITELVAPRGYNLLSEPLKVVITYVDPVDNSTQCGWKFAVSGQNDHLNNASIDGEGIARITVMNSTGIELPSTGGIGTTIFYVVGGILVIGAGIILVAKKRMGKR